MKLVLAVVMICLMWPSLCMGRERPLVGAIRWDAWTGGAITDQVEKTLGVKKYHHRLPWYAEVNSDGSAKIDGNHAEIMEKEIEYANFAGIDYWAFLIYRESNTLSDALKLYLQNKKNKSLKFTVILHNTLETSEKSWPKERDRVIELLQHENYQTVLSNRPLVYAFVKGEFPYERLEEILKLAEDKGLNPYVVCMGRNGFNNFPKLKQHGFDAVSAYTYASKKKTFNELTKEVEKHYWAKALRTKTPYIPMVTTGWDKHPRIDYPVSWEVGQAYHTQKFFPSMAQANEITTHLIKGLEFVKSNQTICEANAIIMYAWNEFDEGGWICPTYLEGDQVNTSRIEAIREVLID